MAQPLIGLDIGSSAVRAVELAGGRDKPVLRAFGQVGLPRGAVSDGEVSDPEVVAKALRRLWEESGFTSRRVVVGISSQRVILRQAEVTAMSESDFRSAIKFEAQELIPIPADDAVLAFRILDPDLGPREGGGAPDMRILLAAAHKEMVGRHLDAVRAAGLDPVVVDPVPLAILRAGQAATDGAGRDFRTEAVVSVGACLTTIGIRRGGVPCFVRVLATGGDQLSAHLAEHLAMPVAVAETTKRSQGVGADTARALAEATAPLVEEIRQTLSFFASQSEDAVIDAVMVAGGGVQAPGLIEELSASLPYEVLLADPLSGIEVEDTSLSGELLTRANPVVLAPLGLALWSFQPESERMSLLPEEVTRARQSRRLLVRSAAAVAGIAVLLVAAGAYRDHQVAVARASADRYQAEVSSVQAQVAALTPITAYDAAVNQRYLAYKALGATDVDWTALLRQIAQHMPANAVLRNFAVSSVATPTASPAASNTNASSEGTLTMTVSGSGGEALVAAWLRDMAKVPSLADVWVPSASSVKGKVHFTSTASVTRKAPLVNLNLGARK